MVVEEPSLSRSIWDAEHVGAEPTYHTSSQLVIILKE